MTHAIDTVFIDAILVPLLRELGLPETLPLKLSPRMQKWIVDEAEMLQRDAMAGPPRRARVAMARRVAVAPYWMWR